MKQLSVFVFMLAFCLTGNAGNLMLVKGGVDCLKNADKLMIELDCSKATYLGDKKSALLIIVQTPQNLQMTIYNYKRHPLRKGDFHIIMYYRY